MPFHAWQVRGNPEGALGRAVAGADVTAVVVDANVGAGWALVDVAS